MLDRRSDLEEVREHDLGIAGQADFTVTAKPTQEMKLYCPLEIQAEPQIYETDWDVSGAIQSTWNDAKSQIKSIVNNVVFPVLDVVLVILLFVKISTLYMEYRKHGQFEWGPVAIIFGCLLFTLTAPLYIWNVVGI